MEDNLTQKTQSEKLDKLYYQLLDNAYVKMENKHTKYDDLLNSWDYFHEPFAVEVFGGVGNEGSVMLKDMFRFVATH